MPDAKSIIGYNDSEAAHKRRVKEGKEAMLMTAPIAKTSFDWTTFSKKLPIGEDDGSEALRRKLEMGSKEQLLKLAVVEHRTEGTWGGNVGGKGADGEGGERLPTIVANASSLSCNAPRVKYS